MTKAVEELMQKLFIIGYRVEYGGKESVDFGAIAQHVQHLILSARIETYQAVLPDLSPKGKEAVGIRISQLQKEKDSL